MTLHPVLAAARNLDGRPRFHPPGQHPATARYRAERAKLLALPATKERNTALNYIEATLAVFEEGESLAKATHLQIVQGHL